MPNNLLRIQGFNTDDAGISFYKPDGTVYRLSFISDGSLRYGKFINGAWTGVGNVLTNADIPDSGWIPCTLKSGITTATNNYGGKSKLSYRKIGNQVHIVGGVGITNYTGNTVISSLPIAYRPETTHYWLSPLTGSRIARCIIGSGGDLVIEWIKNISDGSDYTGNVSWIDMSGVFFAR